MRKRHLAGKIVGFVPFAVNRQMRRLHRGEYLTVLCYHRVMDKPEGYPFDDDLISASVDQFTHQMEYVSKHYNVINFRDLAAHLDSPGGFPRNSLIVTFDDGYVDNYEVAWPILKRFGLTATMFVTTGFIGENRVFWWDRIAYLVKSARAGTYEIPAPASVVLGLGEKAERQEAAGYMIKVAKGLADDAKEEMIQELSKTLDVWVDEQKHDVMMDWDQVRELDRGGIEIGAHSVNHPLFSNVDEERLTSEVNGSKERIESELGNQVVTFGAPGRGILTPEKQREFEKMLRRIVTESGYKFSTQYRWGLVYERDFDPLAIERLGIETYDDDSIFKTKLSFPEIVNY